MKTDTKQPWSLNVPYEISLADRQQTVHMNNCKLGGRINLALTLIAS